MRGALIAVLFATMAGASAPPQNFTFDPQPRWPEDPETEVVCAAIRAECSGMLKDGEINLDWSYDQLYDADGMLVGVRQHHSTGCKPLDEHLVLGERHFTQAFSSPGKPDLDNMTMELAPGVPKDGVRIVKAGTTSVSIGCSS
jgi:hypothetical protein